MKWFKHDSDAHADAKLRRVRLKYGMAGYGLYWYCLELIARGVEKNRLTFELEHDAELISVDTGINRDLVQEMMTFMVDIGLFESSMGVITCLKMATRADEYTQKMLKSGHTPECVGTKSALLEEKRTEQKRTEQKVLRRTPLTEIIEIYHEECPELPRVVALNADRRRKIAKHHNDIMEGDIENWRGYFKTVARSAFLMGRNKDWRADFDFLIKPLTPLKVLEGSYS